jgi:DNA gyrase subunit A
MEGNSPSAKEKIVPVKIEDEMKKSYIDYAMSVIVGRALPDVRDGLKPVHRRILYAMHELGNTHNKPHKKSARIVGEVLGKYHPHGDIAVYDALVRMVQDFSMRYPLIDGQGNFGSLDGDAAAAMRYTEVRISKIAEEILSDIEEKTVDYIPNFDESLMEPTVLPGMLPNLLLNGSSGIAVGMATNVPPHNLVEVVNATIAIIDNKNIDISEIMEHIPGPDFPTGAFIHGRAGIIQAFQTGRGTIKLRAKAVIEEDNNNKERILVTELPYQVNKAKLIKAIAGLVREKKIEGISDLRDESDREGMRIVIEIKGSAISEVVLNQLYKHTRLESTFGIINLAIVDGKPRVLTIKELFSEYITHRIDVVNRRTEFQLKKAERRSHILEGLRMALKNISTVVKIIRGSNTVEAAREALISKFSLTKLQTSAILDMKLQRLAALEREKVEGEHRELLTRISVLKGILASEEKVLTIIKDELIELRDKYGDSRRTEIVEAYDDLTIEDLIAIEDMVVTITNSGYIKRLPVTTYRSQRRGGKGIIGMETKEKDVVSNLFIASTHDYLLFFSNKGKVYWKKVYTIPESGRYSKGKAMVNLLEITDDEYITATIPIKDFDEEHFLLMGTQKGKVKKTLLSAYKNPRRTGIKAITISSGDELICVNKTDGNCEVIMGTARGKSIRFNEKDVRPMGRTAMGVRGIKLRKNDTVVGMEILQKKLTLLTVTKNGFGKRTSFDKYPIQRRGGKGVINIITSSRNGHVIGIQVVHDEDEIMLMSSNGIAIRVPVNGISIIGRITQGVTLMNLKPKDTVCAVERILEG